MRKTFIIALFLGVVGNVFGQKDGYEIDLNIEGCKPGKAILAYYYGNKQYIKDSTRVDEKGRFVFKGEEALPEGIYIAVMPPDNKYFEVMVDADQHFKMNSKYETPIKSMKVTGSDENTLFYNYLRFLNDQKKKSEPLTSKMEELKKADSLGYKELPEFKKLQDEMAAIDEDVKLYKNKFIEDHPKSLLAVVFLGSKDPEIPEAPVDENGKTDSTFAWRWFKDHYWDLIDFSDDRILRTPVFHNKLERFMTKTIYQIPDSINVEASKLVEKTRKSPELFKYTVFWITSHFETSKQMGMDAVFVHMAQSYYCTGQAFWADSTTISKICDRAKKLSYSLIGNTAPNLIMNDTAGKFQVLHAIPNDYTIIYFWDPTCGHCKKTTPKVKEFYDKFKKELNFEIYGVNTNAEERDEWIKYINEHHLDWINVEDPEQKTAYKYLYDIYSTPVIYLLDKDKKIIAKRLGAEDLENFIRHHKKRSS
ncbi:MAG: redoxin domain-containing protein [Flavobacteriales bacterium]|nr:redoxin domain-containing protein [Flavobacteriales bacterium]